MDSLYLRDYGRVEAISRYRMAIFGWQAFLAASNFTHEAANLVLQARRLKARHPSITALFVASDEAARSEERKAESAGASQPRTPPAVRLSPAA